MVVWKIYNKSQPIRAHTRTQTHVPFAASARAAAATAVVVDDKVDGGSLTSIFNSWGGFTCVPLAHGSRVAALA